jgi:glutathionylspermidine synthase
MYRMLIRALLQVAPLHRDAAGLDRRAGLTGKQTNTTMKRHPINVRDNWQSKVEQLGFRYHTLNGEKYWDESVYYEFSYAQVAVLERTTAELYALCLKAVDHVINNNLFDLFFIPIEFAPLIRQSWKQRTNSIYGRFDLSWNGDLATSPRMLEFNADTPTSLFEASVVQWFWLKEFNEHYDQFNSIHEKLVTGWKKLRRLGPSFHFACLEEYPEDLINVRYLQDCAEQAGIQTTGLSVHDIGVEAGEFVDDHDNPIKAIFKLYPWEWMINEAFGRYLTTARARWIEPPWKMILSNKAILPVLWKLFPGHPGLLECHFDHSARMSDYARKPLLSREGANVTIVENGKTLDKTRGEYGEEGFVFQQLQKLPNFDGNFPVLGSWVIDGKPAGMGIRETTSLVTDNFSRFVPHVITR